MSEHQITQEQYESGEALRPGTPAIGIKVVVGAEGHTALPFIYSWGPGNYVTVIIDEDAGALEELQEGKQRLMKYVCLRGPWNNVLPLMPKDSVDIVLAIDRLDGMPDAVVFLDEAARVARSQVIVRSPLGQWEPSRFRQNRPWHFFVWQPEDETEVGGFWAVLDNLGDYPLEAA